MAGYGRGSKPTHLGEGDWLEIAEHAYNAWLGCYIFRHVAHPDITWHELSPVDRDAWVAAVKETAEQLKKTHLR